MKYQPNIAVSIGIYPITLNFMKFSGGEINVRVESPEFTINHDLKIDVHAVIKNSDDVMALIILTDALRRMWPKRSIDLTLPYIPYARQDRVCNTGESLAIKVFCDLINSQNYDSVTVLDPHSDVAPALLDRVVIKPLTELIPRLVRKYSYLVAPDAGSIKKISALSKYYHIPMIRADKTRDTVTGNITGTMVYCDDLGDKSVLIVDDIGDGMRTFLSLGDELKKKTTGSVDLYITHGIFSAGTDIFNGHIDNVYVANSFIDISNKPNIKYSRDL